MPTLNKALRPLEKREIKHDTARYKAALPLTATRRLYRP
jgi:hypothetical protein